jgi:glutathione S-transferase
VYIGIVILTFWVLCRCRYNDLDVLAPTFQADVAVAIDVYWGSGSPYAWRVLLALEYKRLQYTSHILQFSKQEHKSPQMLALNWRGRVPVLKDGDYVCFESLAVLYYLDLKYPEPHIFGRTPEEAGVIMRVICEYQAYIEPHLMNIVRAIFEKGPQVRSDHLRNDQITNDMHHVANEARTIEARLSKSDWVVGESFSAVDMVIFPGIALLRRALERPEARELSSRFMPVEVNYPALGRWLKRVEDLPGYERTYPPHWRNP